MKSYEHISKMETILDDHQALIDQLEALLKAFSEHQKEYRQLADYYSSQQFLTDFDEANSPDFPKDIKCGVLSEDAVFNLLTENHQIALQMLEIALNILKDECA
jgi:antirestriction protein